MRKVRTWFAVLSVLAVVAAACGDDGGDGAGAAVVSRPSPTRRSARAKARSS